MATTNADVMHYRALILAVAEEGDRIEKAANPSSIPARDEAALRNVEQWRVDQQGRIQTQWHNVARALVAAKVPVPGEDEFRSLPMPATAPTAAELQKALNFGPVVAEIGSLLPRRVTFAGFGPLIRVMNINAIIAVVISFVLGIAAGNPYSIASQEMGGYAFVALLVCLGAAFLGWYKHIRSVAQAQKWPFWDVRHQGAVYLAVLMPSLGSAISFSLFS